MKPTKVQLQYRLNFASIIQEACLLLTLLHFSTSFSHALDPSDLGKILPSIRQNISLVSDIDIKNIVLVREKIPNAWIYPTKTIIITAGLVRLIETKAELAFILAHEIAHLNDGEHQKGETVMRRLSGLPKEKNELEKEIKADMTAMAYLKKANYNLSSGISILSRMPESFHFDKRIQAARKYLAQAGKNLK